MLRKSWPIYVSKHFKRKLKTTKKKKKKNINYFLYFAPNDLTEAKVLQKQILEIQQLFLCLHQKVKLKQECTETKE